MLHCKHCGSRYQRSKGQGDFCCSGCEQVFGLIQEGGFEAYYDRQDQAGQPVRDRHVASADNALIHEIQKKAEEVSGCEATLAVRGMSCMGCAWLLEQLARRFDGVRFASVALQSGCLSLGWQRGAFDLCKLAAELQRYGYVISGDVGAARYSISPLSMRLWLTLIFSFNGMLLLMASAAGIGREFEQLVKLLVIVCLFFSQVIGGSLFLRPVWRGVLLGKIHRHLPVALILLVLFLLAVASLLLLETWVLYSLFFFASLPVFVFSLWINERRLLKKRKHEVG